MNVLLFILFITSSIFAGIDSLKYKITPGEYHSGGTLEAVVGKIDTTLQTMEVQIKYNVIKKSYIPAPGSMLKNIFVFELPLDFQDERGYLNLERGKIIENDKVSAKHVGRVNLGKLTNAHHVKITGKNGKYVCDVYYHPSIPELGWSKLGLWLNLSLLSNYQLNADLIE